MSGDGARLQVVLCWHMHQPQYRDLVSGAYHLPWTYLHAIKDYTDMAAHLEAVPAARAVVNFAPLLLDQIEDYTRQIDGYLTNGVAIRDPLLAALAQPVLPAGEEQRRILLHACLRANERRMIERFPAFMKLAGLARDVLARPEFLAYLGDAFFADLLVWYHLAWLGETVRRSEPRVQRLIGKGGQYTLHDRRELLGIIGELLRGIVPRYAQLAGRGQVELSVTPYAHPILPLLLDFQSAREALPEVPLPLLAAYPGGEGRARWHLQEGIAIFERHFGFRPAGCWPSEGGVSEATLRLLSEHGFAWTATGETVLSNSLHRLGHAPHAMKAAWLYTPYRLDGRSPACFFRDDGLSDLIGFSYSSWHADDAVADFVRHLEDVADTCREHPDRLVTIILDGENAWESYPENGYYFLGELYRRLAGHPRLALTTFSAHLARHAPRPLPALVAGSWVYGTFSTWIGDADKNRGWDMLGDAKRVFDQVVHGLPAEQRAVAERALAICEGSDWFWWFGDYNPEETVGQFDQLFRQHLTNLYQSLHVEPPEYLAHAFSRGGGHPARGGTMRPGQAP
jgi:alpha-amylase/alpha-mannosidase (GH57 family)